MIDTDKYEGHTEGEWDLHSMGDGWTIGQLRKIDRTLMQDAPLLLAEVKRKTALADALWDFIEANIPHLIHQATDVWNNHNEEAIE